LLKYAVEVNLQKHWSSLQFGWGWGDNTTAITLSRLLFNVISLKRGLFTLFSNAEVTIGPTSGFVRHFRFFAFLGKLTLAELRWWTMSWEHFQKSLNNRNGRSVPHPQTIHEWEDDMKKWHH